jgi:hypothetical protein
MGFDYNTDPIGAARNEAKSNKDTAKKIMIGLGIVIPCILVISTIVYIIQKNKSEPPVSQPPVSQPPVSQPPVSQPPVSQQNVIVVPSKTLEQIKYEDTLVKLSDKISKIIYLSLSLDKKLRDLDLRFKILTQKIVDKGLESSDSTLLRNEVTYKHRFKISNEINKYRNKVADIFRLANNWNIIINNNPINSPVLMYNSYFDDLDEFNSFVASFINKYKPDSSYDIIVPQEELDKIPLDVNYQDTETYVFVSSNTLSQSSMEDVIKKIDAMEMDYSFMTTKIEFIYILMRVVAKINNITTATSTTTSTTNVNSPPTGLPAAFRAFYTKHGF